MIRMRSWISRGLAALALACAASGLAVAPVAAVPVSDQGPATAALQPWPITITISTVPVLPGVRFLFDGIPLSTDQHGVTTFTERHNFSAHTLTLAQSDVSASGRRYTFVRWAGQRDPNQAYRPALQGLPMRANYTVTASFAVACPVTPHLVDQDGAPLPALKVSQINLLNSLGQSKTLAPSGTTWLPCASPVYRGSLLSARPVLYSVQSVLVGGTNVVHAGVERFSPSQTPEPKVTGFFYSLTITGHDALFGSAVGNYALLTMPDKTVRKITLGSAHTATVSGLPLGDYEVRLAAGSASVSPMTVHLSRNETANLPAISRVDIGLVGAAAVVGLAGAPLLSRTRRRRLLDRARRVYRFVRRAPRETVKEVSLCSPFAMADRLRRRLAGCSSRLAFWVACCPWPARRPRERRPRRPHRRGAASPPRWWPTPGRPPSSPTTTSGSAPVHGYGRRRTSR
jgi:hypothetical protein